MVPISGPLSKRGYHRAAAGKGSEFERWARSREVPVELPFERNRLVSRYTGERHRLVRLLPIYLAAYRDGKPLSVGAVLESARAIGRGEANGDPADVLVGQTPDPE